MCNFVVSVNINYIALEYSLNTFFSDFVSVVVTNSTDSDPGLLLVLVHASGKQVGKERRDAIRATWVSEIDLLSEEFKQGITYK